MNRDVHMEAVSKEKVPTSSSSLHGAESFHPSEENLGDWDVFSYVLHGYGVGDQEKKKVPGKKRKLGQLSFNHARNYTI